MKKMLVSLLIVSGFLLFGLNAGLAQTADSPGMVSSEEVEQFRQCVRTYWEASVNRDWSTIYDLDSEAAKSNVPREEFISTTERKTFMHYLSYELGNVEISGRLAWVEMRLSYKYVFAMWEKNATSLRKWQAWEKSDGKWYALEETEAPSRPPSERESADEMELARRVNEFWKARENRQEAVVYDICDPGFRARIPFERFRSMKDLLAYDSHTLNWVEAANGVGRVKVTYKFRYADPSMSKMEPNTKSNLENWIKVAGVWYRKIKMD